MARLSLKVLGAPEVWHGDKEVLFPTRKTLALLVYLAAEGGKHTRDKMAALFWGDSDDLRGRASLRRALSSIRRELQDDQHAPSSQHVVLETSLMSLNPGPGLLAVDIQAVESALTQSALLLEGAGARSGALAQKSFWKQLGEFERVAATCRGEFLEGFSLPDAPEFDIWLTTRREWWHLRVGLLLERLAELQALTGELASAALTARWRVEHDPFNESAYENLIRLLVASGDRKSAERTYAELRAMLDEEWSTLPSRNTEALLSGRGNARLIPGGPERLHVVPPQPQGLFERYLVGRAVEFQELIANFRAAAEGDPRTVVLMGEAGIGKTRLAAEFLGWAATQGANTLKGRAFEMSGRLPYQPVIEAIRAGLERHNSPDDLLDDVWLAEISRMLPELRERYPDLPAIHKQDTPVNSRLFEAVARLLQAMAAGQPLVLFIDDVQWADLVSLDLLQYIMRRWAETAPKALLLLGLRSEVVQGEVKSVSATVSHWLANLTREAPCKQIALETLTEVDALRLVQSLSGLSSSAAPENKNEVSDIEIFGKELFAETGGQPFFIVETLKALQERGLITVELHDGSEWRMELPAETSPNYLKGFVAPGVRELVQSRLARLSTDAVTILSAAAVLGRDFNFDVLHAVAALPQDSVVAGLETLLATHVFVETQSSRGLSVDASYVFAHDKIREVAYQEIGSARRLVLHRRALEALMSHNAPTAELAHHALAAGHVPLAFHLSLTSGDAALHLFAVRDALTHYERARQLLRDQRGVGKHALRFSATDLKALYSQLGRAYELVNEWEQVRAAYEEMLLLARELQEPYLECAALNRLATLGVHGNPDIQPESLLNEALKVAEQSGDQAGVAETEWAIAQICFVQREAEDALVHAERARGLSHDLEFAEIEARSLNVMAYACTDLNRWEQALSYARKSRLIYEKLGNKAMEADSMCVAANSSVHLGSPHSALELARGAQQISEHIENSWGQVSSGLFITLALMEVDERSAALDVAQRGLALARREVRSDPMLIFALTRYGGVCRGLGMLQQALDAHLEASTLSEEPGLHWWFTEMVAAELCADYGAQGDWARASHYATIALSARHGMLPFVTLLFPELINALVKQGESESASRQVRLFSQQVGDNPRIRLSELRAQAILAKAEDQIAKANRASEQAVQIARQYGLLGELHLMKLPPD